MANDRLDNFKNICNNWGKRIWDTLTPEIQDNYLTNKYQIRNDNQLKFHINEDTDQKLERTLDSYMLTEAMEDVYPNCALSMNEVYNLYNIALNSLLDGFKSNYLNK